MYLELLESVPVPVRYAWGLFCLWMAVDGFPRLVAYAVHALRKRLR